MDLTFDDVFTRFTLNGDRRPALAWGGEPVRLQLKDGVTPYLVFGWRFLTGFSQNAQWLARLRAWIGETE